MGLLLSPAGWKTFDHHLIYQPVDAELMNTMQRYHFIQITALVLLFSATSLPAFDWTNKIPESARVTLEKPEQFELLSLDPLFNESRRPKKEFHGWRILGSMMIKDAEIRNDLVRALEKSAKEREGKGVARCFEPRHGIRAIRDGKTNDLVICFQCTQAQTFENDKQTDTLLITYSPEPVFNKVLKKGKIRLARK